MSTDKENTDYAKKGRWSWYARRDDILREHGLYEEYGDEPPKRPGGEVREDVPEGYT